VTKQDLRKVLALIRKSGALTIRDIDDDVLVEKTHPWASRKPSKRALQLAFHQGTVTISARTGMLKTYELMTGTSDGTAAQAASEKEVADYLLERGAAGAGAVSLDSICHLDAQRKGAIRRLIEAKVRRKELVPVALEGAEGQWGAGKGEHWARPDVLDGVCEPAEEPAHILSPVRSADHPAQSG